MSFHPDPGQIAVNAFHMSWQQYQAYIFPPFCLILRILQKIQQEQCTVVVVVPRWPTQTWWPKLVSLLIAYPILLPKTRDTLILPPTLFTSRATHVPLVWKSLESQGLSAAASNIISQSWRQGTVSDAVL